MADWQGAVARVYDGTCDNYRYRGTAFMVSERFLLTCWHVVKNKNSNTNIFVRDAEACKGGFLPARITQFDEKIDIALLELKELVNPNPVTIPLSEQSACITDQFVDIVGYQESGCINSFKERVVTFGSEWGQYEIPNLVGRGISGAPVLHKGHLVGIACLQDQQNHPENKNQTARTYIVPFNSFKYLLPKKLVLPEKFDGTKPDDSGPGGTKIPYDEIDVVIQKHLNELFEGSLKSVATRIFELAKIDDSQMDIGQLLCSPDVEIEWAIGWLTQAAAEAVQKPLDKIGRQEIKNEIRRNAKKILGWIVLRTMKPEWLKTKGELLDERHTHMVELSIGMAKPFCLEIALARNSAQRHARFERKGPEVRGKLDLGVLCTEAGIKPKDTLDALFRLIWTQTGLPPLKGEITDKEEKDLEMRLKVQYRRGLRRYLTVPLNRPDFPLQNKDINAFHKKFPSIKLILLRFDEAEHEQMLWVDSNELHAHLIDFFEAVIEEPQE